MSESGNYQSFPFAIEFYDHVPFNQSLEDIDFFIEHAKQAEGPVLELGCGTGRVLLPIAESGAQVTGLDISSLMLEVCRSKLENLSASVRDRVSLVEASMHDFTVSERFGLIFSAFRSFQSMLGIDDQLACLRCSHDHLRDDGRLILDVFDPHLPFLLDESRQDESARDEMFTLPDGRQVDLCQRNPAVDLTTQVMACEQIYYVTHADGRKERLVQSFPLRYFFRYEMEHLLARAGFEIEDLYGSYDRAEFGQNRPQEIIVVARKRR